MCTQISWDLVKIQILSQWAWGGVWCSLCLTNSGARFTGTTLPPQPHPKWIELMQISVLECHKLKIPTLKGCVCVCVCFPVNIQYNSGLSAQRHISQGVLSAVSPPPISSLFPCTLLLGLGFSFLICKVEIEMSTYGTG